MKWEVCQFVKLELGMETIYQLALQIILLLMTLTTTATEVGFTEIFKEGPSPKGEDVLTTVITCILPALDVSPHLDFTRIAVGS